MPSRSSRRSALTSSCGRYTRVTASRASSRSPVARTGNRLSGRELLDRKSIACTCTSDDVVPGAWPSITRSLPQAGLLEQGHDLGVEVLHLLVVVDEAHDHSLHAGLVEAAELLDDLLGGAHHRIARPTGDEALLELLDLLVERLALHTGDLHDVLGCAPVALVDHILEGGLGL